MFIVVNYDDGTAEYLECWDDVASPDETPVLTTDTRSAADYSDAPQHVVLEQMQKLYNFVTEWIQDVGETDSPQVTSIGITVPQV